MVLHITSLCTHVANERSVGVAPVVVEFLHVNADAGMCELDSLYGADVLAARSLLGCVYAGHHACHTHADT
jgi:hypothetical protein